MTRHIKASLLGNSIQNPITNGKLIELAGFYLGEHRNKGSQEKIGTHIFGG